MISEISVLSQKIVSSGKIVFFTGAGISTSCGIADFRSPGGIWQRYEIVTFSQFIESEEKRHSYWLLKSEIWDCIKNAKPSFSHRFIKKLISSGKNVSVITQNIDGLHQKAGVDESLIVELHGNNSMAVCLSCFKRIAFDEAVDIFKKQKKSPRCRCGGILKPDVVMFGEPLDSAKLARAFKLVRGCDLIITVGSTLSVQPAASVAYEAKLHGAFYAIINRGPTEHDFIADIKIDGNTDDVFREIDLQIFQNSHQ